MDWSEGAQVIANPASMISGPNDTPTTISSELATGASKTRWSKSYSITRTSTRTRNSESRNSGEAPHSESSSTFHIPSESCTLSVPTEALSTTGDQALHFPVLTTLTSIKFPPTYISGAEGITLPTERPVSEGLVGFSQTVSGLPTPQRTAGAALKLSQPIGLWASWNSGQKAAFLFGSIGLPVILILFGFVLWLRMSRPHRESDRVDHEEKVGAGNNGNDYSDCGGDAHREIENKDQRHMEAAEEEEMASGLRRVSIFSSLSKRGLEKEIIRDSGFAYDHEIHGHISNAATRRISNNDQAKSIGGSSSHSPSDRRDSRSSSLPDDIQGSIDKRELRSSKQSFDASIDKVEQVFSSGSCAGLAIEETSDNAYSLVAGPSSSDMSLRSEPANLVDEKQLDTSSVAQTTLMSPDFSMSSNSLRLIRSFLSFETPQFPELGAETPTDISVQVLPDDNDNRAGTSNAGIHARDELANTSRSHGRGVPVSIVYSHSAHVKTVYAVAAEEGGDARECWQRNTALEGPRHNYGDVE